MRPGQLKRNVLFQRVDSLQHGGCDGDQGKAEETVSKRIVNVGIAILYWCLSDFDQKPAVWRRTLFRNTLFVGNSHICCLPITLFHLKVLEY